MAYVHHETVARSVEHAMERDRQFNHAKIRTEMSARLRQNANQLIAHVLCELRQILFAQRLDVGRRMDSVE